MLELAGFEALLESPDSRTQYIDNLSNEKFVEDLKDLNGIVMNLPFSNRTFIPNANFTSNEDREIEWMHPAPEDKEQLLGDLLIGVKGLKTIEEKSLLLAIGVSAIHPFWEGNGRTARLLYHLLNKGYRPGDPELKTLMSEDGDARYIPNPTPVSAQIISELERDVYKSHTPYGEEGLMLTPKVITVGTRVGQYVTGNLINMGANIGVEDSAMLLGVFNERHLKSIVPWIATEEGRPRFKKHLIPMDEVPPGFEGVTHLFNLDTFTQQISRGDIQAVKDIYSRVKRDYVHSLIGAFSDSSRTVIVPLQSGELVERPMSEILYLTTNHLMQFGQWQPK